MTQVATSGPDGLLCLTVPGLEGSGPDHWQTRWERERGDCLRVEMGCWTDPDPRIWVERLDEAVRGHQHRSILLVAHSLGCQAVAWWGRLFGCGGDRRVLGALLVAPPDVERSPDPRIRRFGPMPTLALPVPALLVASRNDPHSGIDRSEHMAARLGAEFLDIGMAGHINAASRLGSWSEGQRLVDALAARLRTGSATTRSQFPFA